MIYVSRRAQISYADGYQFEVNLTKLNIAISFEASYFTAYL